ncbi:ferric iron uptake transcriptional regulator [soil metagenome]
MTHSTLSDSIQDLLKKKHLLSANQILEHFEDKGRIYNKTSVYRALDQLSADDVICRYDFSDSEAQYELRDHHHDHVICEKCGEIETIECQFTQPVHLKGYHISHHHLTLFGICTACEEKSVSV